MKLKRNSRPRDINQAAFQMVKRSTAEDSDRPTEVLIIASKPRKPSKQDISRVMSAMGKKGGKIGGKRSLETLTPDERKERALKAAKARWAKREK
jgi:hypothetical protein